MAHQDISILALCGSLRTSSINSSLLDAALLLNPPSLSILRYDKLGELPHFNPDVESISPLPDAVTEFRAQVAPVDGLIISCPEYARGVPGAFKNALDWLVGSADEGKSIALWNASPRSHCAQDSLRLVLSTMLGEIVEPACFVMPLMGKKKNARAIADHPELSQQILNSIEALRQHISSGRRNQRDESGSE